MGGEGIGQLVQPFGLLREWLLLSYDVEIGHV
jgi:hypothetical protein